MKTRNILSCFLFLAIFLASCSYKQLKTSENLINEITRALSKPVSSSLAIKEEVEAQIIFSAPYAIRNNERYLVRNLGPRLVAQISDISTEKNGIHFFIINHGQITHYEKWINPAITFNGYYLTKIKPSSRKIEFIIQDKILEKIIVK
ncbi:MAG: hypothetical protein ACL93V_02540 [Candidatus Electrothrix sp. YB6]